MAACKYKNKNYLNPRSVKVSLLESSSTCMGCSKTSTLRTSLGPLLTVLYSETSIIRTLLGPLLTVLFMEVSLFRRFYIVHMLNGAEQWCPVEGGGCISEVFFGRGFTVCKYCKTCMYSRYSLGMSTRACFHFCFYTYRRQSCTK